MPRLKFVLTALAIFGDNKRRWGARQVGRKEGNSNRDFPRALERMDWKIFIMRWLNTQGTITNTTVLPIATGLLQSRQTARVQITCPLRTGEPTRVSIWHENFQVPNSNTLGFSCLCRYDKPENHARELV